MARPRRHPLLFVRIPYTWVPADREAPVIERELHLRLAERIHIGTFLRIDDDPNGFSITTDDYGLGSSVRLVREVMAIVAEVLARPYCDAPGPWEPLRGSWAFAWNDTVERFDAVIQREPYALLVGYRAEGAATRKWYRCKFPIEHPGPDAALNAILRSLGVWLGRVGR